MAKKLKAPKGLRLRGNIWWYSLSVGGHREQASCGTADLKKAVAVLEMRRAQVHEGRYTPNRKKNDLTVEGLRQLWFSRPATEAKRSIKDDRQRFSTIVEILGPRTLVNALTLRNMEAMQKSLAHRMVGKRRPRPISGTTVNRHFALLSSALRHAGHHGYAHQDPLAGLKRSGERQKDDVFTEGQFQALVNHPTVDPEMSLVMWIGFKTGMRLGEIVGMTWDRVDLSHDITLRGMQLREVHSKTGKPVKVPIPDDLHRILLTAKPNTTASGIQRLVGLNKGRVSARFSALAKSLNYEGTFHALRHTAISRMNAAGVDLATIMSIVGHKVPATTLRYINISQIQKHAAVEGAGKKLMQPWTETAIAA